MQRAMEDAAGESDAEGEDHLMSEDDPELDASSEGSLSRDFAMSHDNLDEDADTEDDAEEALPLGSSNPNYLPDDLFTTAFASSSQPEAPSSKRHLPTKARKPKRKPARNKAKDTIIGPRAIRVLPKLTHQASQTASYTVPSQNVTKFLTRSLNLKGQKPKKQAWQRLPANIGVMKRSGPAATFVRR
ncbi:hypothetical protein OE88DRAFT_1666150 [Heliocybe sulcata]|uniref:Uncharacterized protein n=1 Tax=Heliocybe sulcata TaxID=5364 RepID=A0A5C3MRC9_9AGAM|nr:hypothetical protein OE88DRAFT_1666150 [Heliocybe sulcata]